MVSETIKRNGYSKNLNKEQIWDIYKSMKTQRLLEERLLKMYKGGQLSGARREPRLPKRQAGGPAGGSLHHDEDARGRAGGS